jgi:hypothetical protein
MRSEQRGRPDTRTPPGAGAALISSRGEAGGHSTYTALALLPQAMRILRTHLWRGDWVAEIAA